MQKLIAKRLLGLTVMVMALLLTVACGSKVPDSKILEQTKQALAAYQDVSVEVKDGVVTLAGTMPSEDAIKTVVGVVAKIPGVKSVDNKIQVKVEDPLADAADSAAEAVEAAGQYLDDAAITAEVKSQLLLEKDIAAFDIAVSTTDRVVTLTGTVNTKAQADLAVDIAAKAKDVTSVNNQLKVKQ